MEPGFVCVHRADSPGGIEDSLRLQCEVAESRGSKNCCQIGNACFEGFHIVHFALFFILTLGLNESGVVSDAIVP